MWKNRSQKNRGKLYKEISRYFGHEIHIGECDIGYCKSVIKWCENKQRQQKENNMLIQQGDVLIKKIDNIKGKKLNHLTLAQGESTGHHHTITEGEAELYEDNSILYLRVNSEEAILTHQEHNPVVIEKGDYEIGIVREYDHFAEESRRIAD